MTFKTLDIEKDPLNQGYVDGTYDVVVAFFVIHATSNLEQSLHHLRKLIRPGGFLVVGEGQEGLDSVASSGFIFGTLPGWWLGAGDNGRNLSPHISPQEWDRLLRATGFSGTDVSVPASWQDVLNVHHFVTQAVDDQILLLREPLIPTPWELPPIEKLAIVGGMTERTCRLVEELQGLLSNGFSTDVRMVKALTEIDFDIFDDINTTILSLAELDKPVFDCITPETFQAVKRVFGSGKRVFWVTSDRQDTNPFSNMTVGFGRVAANESPDLRLQQLDIQDPETVNAQTVAEIFLRFYASDFQSESVLWSREAELRIDWKGRQLISRLRPASELNDRYNSVERPITHETNIDESPVIIEQSESGTFIRPLPTWENSLSNIPSSGVERLNLCVSLATTSAIRTPFGHKFVVLGSRPEDGSRYLAFASELASILITSAKLAIPLEVATDYEKDLLFTVSAHLVAAAVIGPAIDGQSALIHNAGPITKRALEKQAAKQNIQVMSTTDFTHDYERVATATNTSLTPDFDTCNDVEEVLMLNNTVVFVDFGSDGSLSDTWDAPCKLPAHCRMENVKTLYSSKGSNSLPHSSPVLVEMLEMALQFAENELQFSSPSLSNSLQPGFPAISMADFVKKSHTCHSTLGVVEFNRGVSVPVQATRLDVRPMFRGPGCTYWIAGITGALGISLCDWMIRSGARSIVITSRAPEVSSEWISAHRRRGSTVTVIAW